MTSLTARNNASRRLLHGSASESKTSLAFHHDSPGATTRVVKCPLIIAALTLLASGICTPTYAQEPHAGPLIDGSIIQDIREARQDLRDLRQSISEGRDESTRWRDLLHRWEQGEGPLAKLSDRIGNLVWLVCGTIVLVGLPLIVVVGIRELRLWRQKL